MNLPTKLGLLNFQGIIKAISIFVLALMVANCSSSLSKKLKQTEDKPHPSKAKADSTDYFNDLSDPDYFNDSDYFNGRIVVVQQPRSVIEEDADFKKARIMGERRKAILKARDEREARLLADRQRIKIFTMPFPIDGSSLDRFLWSLGMFESSGRYDARNPSGAYGKYQFMPRTWRLWTKRYAQNNDIPLANIISQTPLNQERVARFKVQTLLSQYGSFENAASIWFTGKPYYYFHQPWNINDGRTRLPNYIRAIKKGMSATKK